MTAFLPEIFLEQADQARKFDGIGFAEIENFVHRAVIIDRRPHALNDVVDICVIAAGGSVAKDLYRLVLPRSVLKIYGSPDRVAAARRKP